MAAASPVSIHLKNARGAVVEPTLQGEAGADYYNTTTARTGRWGAITATEEATFTLLTATGWGGNSTVGLILPAGATIFGDFTAITLASGAVIAYRSR